MGEFDRNVTSGNEQTITVMKEDIQRVGNTISPLPLKYITIEFMPAGCFKIANKILLTQNGMVNI